jgi:hypothetical protein
MKSRSFAILLFTISFLFASALVAQDRSGVKAGINLSSITGDSDANKDLKAGLSVGVFTRLPLADMFAIQPELLYNSKGVKYNYDNVFVNGETKFKLHYIELPVKLVFEVTDNFDIQFGPYLSYLVQAKVESDAEVLGFFDISNDEELDRDHFNPFDYGLTGGINFNFRPLLIGVSYSLGLHAIAKDDKAAEAMIGNGKNSVLQLHLGIIF